MELTGNEKTLAQLTTSVNNNDFKDILDHRAFLYITSDKGIVRVNSDKTIDILDGTDLSEYVKNTDYATSNKGGVVKIQSGKGINIQENGVIYVAQASDADITARESQFYPITPSKLNLAVKSALSDNNRISDMTDEEKVNAREVIGAASSTEVPKSSSDLEDSDNIAKKNANNNFSTAQTINGTLTVNGNIVQNGQAYETHAEQLYTKNDIIKTREGAVGGLAEGEYTGIEAEKYDGTNNGRLVFGADGVARVGDVGDEQPLLTRAEVAALTDGQVLIWDGTTLKAVGSSAFVKNTDYANGTVGGVVKVGGLGIAIQSGGALYVVKATDAEIDARKQNHRPIVPSNLDYAVRSVRPATADAMPATLAVNTLYSINNTSSTSVALTLPQGQNGDFIQYDFVTGTTAPTVTIQSTYGMTEFDFTPEASKIYSLFFDWGIIAVENSANVYGWRISYAEYDYTPSTAETTGNDTVVKANDDDL